MAKAEKKQISCYMPLSTLEYVDAYAARFGVSRGSAIALLCAKVQEQEEAVKKIGEAVKIAEK